MKRPFSRHRSDTILILIAGGISILAFLCHRPVRMIDALTLDQALGFGIEVRTLRVLFEPFVGIPLFFLRGENTLPGLTILLIYILLLFLIFETRAHGPIGAARLSPLVGGIGAAIVWLTVVTPLPSNTIQNLSQEEVLLNSHCHTDKSQDGIMPLNATLRWHRHNRFDAFFLTEHNFHKSSLESVRAQEQGELEPYPLLLAGEEYWGSNHMTLLGLQQEIPKEGLSEQEVVQEVHRHGGAVIVAHWFEQELKSIPFFMDLGVDGFEIVNQAVGSYNRKVFNNITGACSEQNRVMVGAVDNHGYGITCGVWTALRIPGWREMERDRQREEILTIFRERQMDRILVLSYEDRPSQSEISLLFLPVFNLIHYFRSLVPVQVASWILWLFIIAFYTRLGNNIRAILLKGLALLSGVYLAAWGVIYHGRADRLPENLVYPKYSIILLATGLLLIVYVIVLLWWVRRKNMLKEI